MEKESIVIDYENRFILFNKRSFMEELSKIQMTPVSKFDSLFYNLKKEIQHSLELEKTKSAYDQSEIISPIEYDNENGNEHLDYLIMLSLKRKSLFNLDERKWYEDADFRLSYNTQVNYLDNWLDKGQNSDKWHELDILTSTQRKDFHRQYPDSLLAFGSYYVLDRDFATKKLETISSQLDSVKSIHIRKELESLIKSFELVNKDSILFVYYSH